MSEEKAPQKVDIFVFASNPHGHHVSGSALRAYEDHGAMWGVGEGASGTAYAIPLSVDEDATRAAVARFLAFAADWPATQFVVAFDLAEGLASAFAGRSENVVMPEGFVDVEPAKQEDEQ